MNQYPEEYSGYGQSGNSMQAMGFHQSSYENANMVSSLYTVCIFVAVVGLVGFLKVIGIHM